MDETKRQASTTADTLVVNCNICKVIQCVTVCLVYMSTCVKETEDTQPFSLYVNSALSVLVWCFSQVDKIKARGHTSFYTSIKFEVEICYCKVYGNVHKWFCSHGILWLSLNSNNNI